nr:MAG TPA: putative AdoMet-dependent methyltransferase [Caudoviricetes sp.]
MTNREKFAEQILDIACGGSKIAVNKATLEPTACYKLTCKDCLFGLSNPDSCTSAREKWANSEYVEPPVDWSKVAVDTPILVTDNGDYKWIKRYFAKYENGIVYAWSNGTTSWSGDRCTPWKLAKLPERSSNGEINE